MMINLNSGFLILICLLLTQYIYGYRVYNTLTGQPNGSYPKPFDRGFVGVYGLATNYGRERVNEGSLESPAQELIYGSNDPRQSCPGMVGPFTDGNYYCTAKEFGYCDRRSGTCFCNIGYQGIDCSECQGTHFRVGNLCYPKKLCPSDCNGAGTCNFNTGTCACLPHRMGVACEIHLCSNHSSLCQSCTEYECLSCLGGYYLTGDTRVCSSCYDFDPRCSGCTKELGCTNCADSVLTSVHRSGYRSSDPRLPFEEDSREFSITLPFGTKHPDSFAEAETYFVNYTTGPLKNFTQECVQGVRNDSVWDCYRVPATHVVCGHYGVFSFEYPNYIVSEKTQFIRLVVRRSGGGYGSVSINYYIKHFTTNDSDVSAAAFYTTSQKLTFSPGVIRKSFQIQIFDDNIVEDNEVFQVVLETPEGGGSVGPQFRANVTIIDDDLYLFSATMSKLAQNYTSARAGMPFSIGMNAAIAYQAQPMTMGGAKIFATLENYEDLWISPGSRTQSQRQSVRHPLNVTDNGDGTYLIYSNTGVLEQGNYQLRAWQAFPNGLRAEYFYDGFFQRLALQRIDRSVNFTWGSGRIISRVSDYMAIRWSGAILASSSGSYYFQVLADDNARLWLDGNLLLDHWNELEANLEPSREYYLEEGRLYEIVLEYREIRGEAYAYLLWGLSKDHMSIIPQENLFSLFEIDRSPATVHITSTDTSALTTECEGEGLFSGEALKMSHFSFCPRDIYGNMRDDDDYYYLVSAPFVADLYLIDDQGYNGVGSEHIRPLLTFNNDTYCFDGKYTPQRAGYYQLNITYSSWRFGATEHVVGSPFYVQVRPSKTFASYSEVFGLQSPLYLEAGHCTSFTVVSRDAAKNLRKVGGDLYEAYIYQIDYYSEQAGSPVQWVATPTYHPTASPTFRPTTQVQSNAFSVSPPLETKEPVVRYGQVVDHGQGNYTVSICPVIAGWFEIHVLLSGRGVSNSQFQLMAKQHSLKLPLGRNTYLGSAVANSPYSLVVTHSLGVAHSCSASGPGLISATVGIPNSFLITVRDPWDNVLRSNSYTPSVEVKLDRSPSAVTSIWNYLNGSYAIEYVANVSGPNLISVYVNSLQIPGSPFPVYFADGATSASTSYAVGDGLHWGIPGVPSYFELFSFDMDGNRKSTSSDVFEFVIIGSNNITGTLQPCPYPAEQSHPICTPNDNFLGHYFGVFTPMYTGDILISVFLVVSDSVRTEISNSPFTALVSPAPAVARNTDVSGTLYSNEAGVPAFINIQLRDEFRNKLNYGGYSLELALLGVGVEWGTIQPWNSTPGLPNAYHYKGFFAGYPSFYGSWVDHEDGTLTGSYVVNLAGEYVLRISLAQEGLNVTYFNSTDFGYLVTEDFSLPGFVESKLGAPVNIGDSISWTGDIGGLPGNQGDLGSGTYFDRFLSRVDSQVNFNLSAANGFNILGHLNGSVGYYKSRQEYFSVRWTGMITPLFAEVYNFRVVVDGQSNVQLRIGGVGNEFNQSDPGAVVLEINDTSISFVGSFNFTDLNYREFVLEYAHTSGDSHLSLLWESPSTPLALVPSSAFTHWVNISHYNMTIYPTKLCSSCSTSYGSARYQAIVGEMASFVVYARDVFGNLLQHGGDMPSMLAVGPEGVAFRGSVIDYGNSTYQISYLPTVAGQFTMYVTMGCCPPHPNIGLPSELNMISPLLIGGTPFLLNVLSAPLNISRSVAVGQGLLGGIAGEIFSFNISYRDLFNNPTIVSNVSDVSWRLSFRSNKTGDSIVVNHWENSRAADSVMLSYNLTRAGSWLLAVELSYNNQPWTSIVGSPFLLSMAAHLPDPTKTVCRGLGLRNSSTFKSTPFEIHLIDEYQNSLHFGGNKFFIRLIGDANFTGEYISVPTCKDQRDGNYICRYMASNTGFHQLEILLLNSSRSYPGGTGLTAKYFSTSLSSDTQQLPIAVEIVPRIDFHWPTGNILPRFVANVSFQPSLAKVSQSVIFTGYLVSPRTDRFDIFALVKGASVAVFLDADLIFDNEAGIQKSSELLENAAYELRVEMIISSIVSPTPLSLSLLWSTSTIPASVIPKFYLYDSAQPVFMSPFPISIS